MSHRNPQSAFSLSGSWNVQNDFYFLLEITVDHLMTDKDDLFLLI